MFIVPRFYCLGNIYISNASMGLLILRFPTSVFDLGMEIEMSMREAFGKYS